MTAKKSLIKEKDYNKFLRDVLASIEKAKVYTARGINIVLAELYFKIGEMIVLRQEMNFSIYYLKHTKFRK